MVGDWVEKRDNWKADRWAATRAVHLEQQRAALKEGRRVDLQAG